jgi:uncharacterized protein (TIGR02265 family)
VSVSVSTPSVYGQAVEGLVRGLDHRLTPALDAELRELGVDLKRPLLPLYPQQTWFAALHAAARHGWPGLDEDQALFELGRAVFHGFSSTLVGRAILKMLLVLGPRRSLGRLRASFRSADTYTESTLVERSSNEHEVWLNQPTFNPGYVRGILMGMLEITRANAPSVTVVSRDERGVTYRVTWS